MGVRSVIITISMDSVLPEILDILLASWALGCMMAPYLLGGFIMAGVLSVWLSSSWVERNLGGRGGWSVLKASLFGVPLPLCSCGVVPVAASLRRRGAGKGATSAFLISTPQTGAENVFALYSLMGPVYALVSPVIALVTGWIGGGAVDALAGDDARSQSVGEEEVPADEGPGRWRRAARHAFVTLPRDIAGPLLLGLLVAGVISRFVPHDALSGKLGGPFGTMALMLLVSIPLYVCASGSIPIAWAMVHAGISPGAALLFLIAGPTTNAASLITAGKILGKKAVVVHLLSIVFCAVGFGLLMDVLPGVKEGISAKEGVADGAHGTGLFGILTGSLLLLLLAGGLIPRRGEKEKEGDREIRIEGMTCEKCAEKVRQSLGEVAGISEVRVLVKEGRALYRGEEIDPIELKERIRKLGFRVAPS